MKLSHQFFIKFVCQICLFSQRKLLDHNLLFVSFIYPEYTKASAINGDTRLVIVKKNKQVEFCLARFDNK